MFRLWLSNAFHTYPTSYWFVINFDLELVYFTRMVKIAITADVHFGVPGRLNDILWSVRVIREYCANAGIDTVLVLGDLFHDRRAIALDTLSYTANFFEDTINKYNQQWVVFPGNHDMFLRNSWEVNSLASVRRCLTVIEDIKLLTIDDHRFWILPFITYEKSFMKVLRAIEKQYKDGDTLLTHVGIKGAELNTCFMLKDWSIISFDNSKFRRVYTGHFHSRQQVGSNVWYPGSPIPFKFDEGGVPHGFYVYDTSEQDHKFINIWKAGAKFLPGENLPPQFYTIMDDDLATIGEDIASGNIVRIALKKDYTADELNSIKQKLLGLGAKSVRWMDITKKIEQREVIDTKPSKNLFMSWVDSDNTGTKNLDRTILLKLNDEIICEGDEKYSIEESE